MDREMPFVCIRCGERVVSNHRPDTCQQCGSVSVVPDRWTEYDYDQLNHAAAERAYASDAEVDAAIMSAMDEMSGGGRDFAFPWWAGIAAAAAVVWMVAWIGISNAAMADCQAFASFDTCFYTLNR